MQNRESREHRRAFGDRLRALRKNAGLSQEQLAQKAGFDRSFYSNLEQGKHSVLLDRVFDLANALDVEIADLFERDDYRPR